MKGLLIFFLILFSVLKIKCQTEIARESFSNKDNLTASHGYTSNGYSCFNSAKDWFELDNCMTGGLADGGDDQHFIMQDYDGVLGTSTPYLDINLGSVPADKPGEITFYGLFGALTGSMDAGDGATIAVNINGAGFNTILTISHSGGNLQISDGVTTDALNTTWVKRSVVLGSALNSQTIVVRVTATNLTSSSEGLFFDEFSLTASCGFPVTSPSGLNITNVSNSSLDLDWTNNSGDKVLVVARETNITQYEPTRGTSYTADANYGLGDQIGYGNYVVYNGSSNAVTITSMPAGESMTFSIYAYNSADNCYNLTELSGTQALLCGAGGAAILPAKFRTCSTDRGSEISDAGTLSFNIEVSGLSAPLASATNNLRQVKVYLFNGSDENLSNYTCVVKAPDGTTSSTIFTTGKFGTSDAEVKATFRETSRLNHPSGSDVEPYDIGYYKINTTDDFTTQFDTYATPNGTWSVVFTETSGATLDDIQLDFVELEFGPSFSYTDIANDGSNCNNAYELVAGDYFSSNSNADNDDGVQPTRSTICNLSGLTGCPCWNADYNRAQYLKFTATGTYINLSLSGNQSSALQALVVEGNPTACSANGDWTVKACPNSREESTSNSLDGRSFDSGAGSSSGSSKNLDFSMDNAEVGKVYYLVIDGDAGATANYFIHINEGVATTLPIKLKYFNAVLKDKKVFINWETLSEINNDHFFIERSVDGKKWEFVSRTEGAGNSNYSIDYNSIDLMPYYGHSYYRLVQYDFDGHYSTSDIVDITFNQEVKTGQKFYPNPISKNGTIYFADNIISAEIYDVLGRVVYSINNNNISNLDLSKTKLIKGNYNVILKDEFGDESSHKLILTD